MIVLSVPMLIGAIIIGCWLSARDERKADEAFQHRLHSDERRVERIAARKKRDPQLETWRGLLGYMRDGDQ